MKKISVLCMAISALVWVNFVLASNVSIPCNLVLDEDEYARVSVAGFAPPNISTLFPNEEGSVGFVVEIKTKRHVIKQFTGNAFYQVVGSRIEFERPDYDMNSAIINLYREEFRETFGMLPDVKCYLP